MFGLAGRSQRILAWAIVAIGIALTIWLAVILIRGWIDDGRSEAVRTDRIEASGIARNAQVAAEREAAATRHADELAAERARAEQMEAINESLHDPGGDPVAAVYDRMRKGR